MWPEGEDGEEVEEGGGGSGSLGIRDCFSKCGRGRHGFFLSVCLREGMEGLA